MITRFLLLGFEDEPRRALFFSTIDLFNLKVNSLPYDTTNSYLDMEDGDEGRFERKQLRAVADDGLGPDSIRPRPRVVNDPPPRSAGLSKDHRRDCAQVIVSLVVVRERNPLCCWARPRGG